MRTVYHNDATNIIHGRKFIRESAIQTWTLSGVHQREVLDLHLHVLKHVSFECVCTHCAFVASCAVVEDAIYYCYRYWLFWYLSEIHSSNQCWFFISTTHVTKYWEILGKIQLKPKLIKFFLQNGMGIKYYKYDYILIIWISEEAQIN